MKVDSVDQRFALIAKDGSVHYPYQKAQKATGRFGYAMSAPGERDARSGGAYTTNLEEVIKKVVFDGWKVRVKEVGKPGVSGTVGKIQFPSYWVSDELIHLVSDAPLPPTRMPGIARKRSVEVSRDVIQSLIRTQPSDLTSQSAMLANNENSSIENLQNELNSASEIAAIEFVNSPGKDIDAVVKRRVGQSAFRRLLEKIYGPSCFVSGLASSKLLIASHIVPWSRSLPEQKTDPDNGLLLSVVWDALFDKGFISFDGKGALLCSPLLDQDARQSLGISLEVRLSSNFMTERRMNNISWHRENVFDKVE